MISAKTKLVGLIGWPVSHSVSPAMHNAAFEHLGLDWCYVPLPVNPEPAAQMGAALAGLAALGFIGANVTVPHKQAAMPHLHRLTPAAQAIGAVNTIVVEPEGALLGDNTDAAGFVADLRDHGVHPTGQRVLVLGAGGSARAVVYGLADSGAAQIVVLNRSVERATALCSLLQPIFPRCTLVAGALPDDIARWAAGCELVINCTSLGMTPHSDSTPWDDAIAFRPGQVVYDLVYNPPLTRLLRQADRNGARVIGGLGMLIWQGALAFDRWTGQSAPVEIMRQAAEAILATRRAPAPGTS